MGIAYAGWMTPSAPMATNQSILYPAFLAGFLFGPVQAQGAPEAPPSHTSTEAAADVLELAWLSGTWQYSTPEGQLEEHWLSPAPGRMIGVGRLVPLKPDPTAFFELLRIEASTEGLALLASPMGGPPVRFTLVESGLTKLVFANPTHGYPQRIAYWREQERLCVGIGSIEGPWRESWCYRPLPPS